MMIVYVYTQIPSVPSLPCFIFVFLLWQLTFLSRFDPELYIFLQATPRLLDTRRVIKELPDPQLQGNFPEEEMRVMAYLAKECLLLDPDSRPSMSEVVQILSTIAPEKSRRQNFPLHLYPVGLV